MLQLRARRCQADVRRALPHARWLAVLQRAALAVVALQGDLTWEQLLAALQMRS